VPAAIVAGADGTLFVADLESQRIVRVPADDPATAIATVAGVRGLCLAPNGDLLATTTGTDAVRRLTPTEDGTWTMSVAVAGRPFRMPHAAALGPDGALYIADNYAACVWMLSPADDGQFKPPVRFAAGAPLQGPTGLWLDASTEPARLLVADPKAKALFAVRLEDGATTTLAE